MEGRLFKRGDQFLSGSKWKARKFVLKGPRMEYYDDKRMKKGEFTINQASELRTYPIGYHKQVTTLIP